MVLMARMMMMRAPTTSITIIIDDGDDDDVPYNWNGQDVHDDDCLFGMASKSMVIGHVINRNVVLK